MTLLLEPMLYVFLFTTCAFMWSYTSYLTTIVDLAMQSGNGKLASVNLVTYFAAADLFGN